MEEIAVVATPESTAVETTPIETTPTVETTSPETPPTEPTTETPPEGDEKLPGEPEDDETVETDARKLDDRTRKMVAELKKSNPAAAKELANQFFRRLAYEKEFPTVQDARQAKATIESLGGEEGISKLNEEVSDYRNEIDQFAKGDPALVEQLYKANPESTVKMVEAALDIFAQNKNIDALDTVLLRPIVQRLKDVGLTSNLIKAADFIKAGKGQEAYDTLGAIGEWLSNLIGQAEKSATTRTTKDPREEQFAKERQELDREKRENFDRGIATQVNELNNASLSKVIGNFYKEVGLEHEGKREFTQAVLQKIWAAMKADKVFQRQAHAIKAKGDKTRTAEFINSKFSELAPKIFRSHKNLMYPRLATAAPKPNGPATAATNGSKAAAKVPPASGPTGAPVKVANVPKFEEVDWDKTHDVLWASGKAHLKNGKYVNFY